MGKTFTPLSRRAAAARALAGRLAAEAWRPISPSGRKFQRGFAMGDPQAPLERIFAILDGHDLLGDDGRLAADAFLVTMGDHFDYGPDHAAAAEDAVRLIHWLAAHPPDQVVILAGNHDLSRVVELWRESDASYTKARELARSIVQTWEAEEADGLRRRFRREHPDIPTPESAARDYATFSEAQRRLVQSLLLGGRFVAGYASRMPDGTPILLSHAGVTQNDLEELGIGRDRRPSVIAAKMAEALRSAIESVRAAWSAGVQKPLDPRPLYFGGGERREGGGILSHRPSDPERAVRDAAHEFEGPMARRFDPRGLPIGLVQACGHSGHRKCRLELARWVTPSAMAVQVGGLRTLRTNGNAVVYEMGIQPARADESYLYLIDGEMNRVPPETYALFPLLPEGP